MLPERYPSATHLPFNSTALAGRFVPESPDRDPGGERVWLLLRGGELLLDGNGLLPCGTVPPPGSQPQGAPLHIGRWDGRPCSVLSLSRQEPIPSGLHGAALGAAEPQLPIELLTLGGCAGQILHWQRDSHYCASCGASNTPISGTWGKRCSACGSEHFPHIHPCVIVLVQRPGELLLARKAGWPEGRYGLIAGFLDFGENLEEAVAREVREEVGVTVGDVRYLGSQCWPFPSQMMAGFAATWESGAIRVDTTELEDARWFALDALPNLPPKRSIARYLLDTYLAGTTAP